MKNKTCKIRNCSTPVSRDDRLLCDKCFLYVLSWMAASDRIYLTTPELVSALESPKHMLHDQLKHWYIALQNNQFYYVRQVNITQLKSEEPK